MKMLKGVAYFKELGDEQLKSVIKICELKKYMPGETIFVEGQNGGRVYWSMCQRQDRMVGESVFKCGASAVTSPLYASPRWRNDHKRRSTKP